MKKGKSFSNIARMVAFVVVVAASASIGAAEVAYTGGGAAGDLSDPANWGGTAPGASNVGVVDCSTYGHSFALGSNAAFSGLRFTGDSAELSIGGSGTLTLGGDGLTKSGSGKLTFSSPVSLSAAQTWNLGGGQLATSGSISGSSDLAVEGISTFSHNPLPGYGGKITYTLGTGEIVPVYNSKWADSVSIKSKNWYLNPTETTYFSTLLPGGISNVDWVHMGLCSESGKTLVVDQGAFSGTGSDFMCILGGTLLVDGGSVTAPNHLTVGNDANVKAPVAPMTLDVRSGSLSSVWLLVGANSGTENGTYHSVVSHSGGNVSVSSLEIGGWTVDPTLRSNQAYTVPRHAEYVLDGANAVLDISNTTANRNYGISLSSNIDKKRNPRYVTPGVFTQKSGTARVSRVLFGADYGRWATWGAGYDDVPGENGYGYGLFSLRGGTFELGSAGFALGRNWNNGSVTQSVYDVELAGGMLKPTAGMEMELAFRVPDRGATFNWNTSSGTNKVYAPVSGDGTLRKIGAGALVLSDAVDFSGTIEVAEGTLAVAGIPVDTADDIDCLVYTADSLAALADGDSVSSWSDTDGALAMVADPDSGYKFGAPTFVSAGNSVFNGHAAVRFSASDSAAQALKFSSADNPIGGETNVTLAIVFNPRANGISNYENNYVWRYNRILFGTPSANNDLLLAFMNGGRLVFGGGFVGSEAGGNSPKTPSASMSINAPHVIVATLRDKDFILDVDGGVSVTNSFRADAKPYPRHRTAEGVSDNKALYIGASTIDNSAAYSRSFIGDIAEIRIYRGRALDDAERRGVMYSLMAKYQGADEALAYRGKMAASEVVAEFAPGDAPDEVTPEATSYTWSAESLASDHVDGDAVALWTTAGGKQATADSNATAPTFAAAAMNGHPAVRFDAKRSQCLGINYSQLPYTAAGGAAMDANGKVKCYSIAVVFQSTVEGSGTAYAMYDKYLSGSSHVGIVGNMHGQSGGAWAFDTAITWDEGGSVGSCSGTYAGQYYNSPRKPVRLDDGKPHVAILSRDFDTGNYSVMVDGQCCALNLKVTSDTARSQFWSKFYLGALTHSGTGCFSGDIAEVRFYEKALSESEMSDLTEYWTQKYGVRRFHKGSYGLAKLDRFGLGATNITVASGAKLVLPRSASNPYAATSGASLHGSGDVAGSVRYSDGGVLDYADVPNIEDVQIADGARVKLGDAVLSRPIDGGNISAISGNVVIDVTDVASRLPKRSKLPLLSVAPEAVAAGVSFTVEGGSRSMSAVYDAESGCLVLCQHTGFQIIFR